MPLCRMVTRLRIALHSPWTGTPRMRCSYGWPGHQSGRMQEYFQLRWTDVRSSSEVGFVDTVVAGSVVRSRCLSLQDQSREARLEVDLGPPIRHPPSRAMMRPLGRSCGPPLAAPVQHLSLLAIVMMVTRRLTCSLGSFTDRPAYIPLRRGPYALRSERASVGRSTASGGGGDSPGHGHIGLG